MTTSDDGPSANDLMQLLAADVVALRARAEKAEAALEAMRKEPSAEEKHNAAELTWSEMYGIRRLNMEECAKDLEDIMGGALTAFLAARGRP